MLNNDEKLVRPHTSVEKNYGHLKTETCRICQFPIIQGNINLTHYNILQYLPTRYPLSNSEFFTHFEKYFICKKLKKWGAAHGHLDRF